jgi:hypothetical protein
LVPITEEASEAIQRYLAEGDRKVGISGPMFLAEVRAAESRGDIRLSAFGIRFVLKRLVRFSSLGQDTRRLLEPVQLSPGFGSRTPFCYEDI